MLKCPKPLSSLSGVCWSVQDGGDGFLFGNVNVVFVLILSPASFTAQSCALSWGRHVWRAGAERGPGTGEGRGVKCGH